jgi:hypothetical protein
LEKIKRLEAKTDGHRQAFAPDTHASAYLTEILRDIREIRSDLEAAGAEGEAEPLEIPVSERKQIRDTLTLCYEAMGEYDEEIGEKYRNALLLLDTEPMPESKENIIRVQVAVYPVAPTGDMADSWVKFFNQIISEVDIPPA